MNDHYCHSHHPKRKRAPSSERSDGECGIASGDDTSMGEIKFPISNSKHSPVKRSFNPSKRAPPMTDSKEENKDLPILE